MKKFYFAPIFIKYADNSALNPDIFAQKGSAGAFSSNLSEARNDSYPAATSAANRYANGEIDAETAVKEYLSVLASEN